MKLLLIRIFNISFFILIIFMLMSCDNNFGKNVKEPQIASVSNVYKSTKIALPEKYQPHHNFQYNDRVYTSCKYKADSDETTETYIDFKFVSVDYDGNSYLEIDVDNVKDGAIIEKVALGYYNDYYIYEYTVDEDGRYDYYLHHIITKDINQSNTNNRQIDYSRHVNDVLPDIGSGKMAVDKNGFVYLDDSYIHTVHVFDRTGSFVYDVTYGGWMDGIYTTDDGDYIIRYDDEKDHEMILKVLDHEKKEFFEIEVSDEVKSYGAEVYINSQGEIYHKDNTGLYSNSKESVSVSELCNWINSDVLIVDIYEITVISRDKFIAIVFENATRTQNITIYDRVSDDEVKPKKIITLAVMSTQKDLSTSLVYFNRSSDEYRVVIKDYSVYNTQENPNGGLAALNNDIVTGEIADAFLVQGLAYNTWAEKGLFCDLYEFFDRDVSFDESILVDCVKKPLESNGKLYQLATHFVIDTLVTKKESIITKNNWTIENMIDIDRNLNADSSLFLMNMIQFMRGMIFRYSMSDFIDIETGKCNFTNDNMINILEYLNSLSRTILTNLSEEEIEEYHIHKAMPYRKEKILLYEATISTVIEYLRAFYTFDAESSDDIVFIGYPSSDGGRSVVRADKSYAIYDDSPVKDGAWQFLKFLVSEDNVTPFNSMSLSSVKQALINEVYSYVDVYTYMKTDGFGMRTSSEKLDDMPEIYEEWIFTEDHANKFIEYLDSINTPRIYYEDILNIIIEETDIYFAGMKTAQETADVIQNRASLYLSEKR